jgi:hypothetical protein
MRILKTHVLLRFVNSYLVDSPQPANITYLWNFGSLLATCLIIQILTGAFLAMHYTPNVDFAFNSIEHIMRDVNNGWLIRYTHANVASFFFIFVYAHIGRGLYYSSYKSPRVLVWSIGVIILILMMAIAFLGYVLPYGQMSLWGATVITNLLSAIPVFGQDIVELKNIIEYINNDLGVDTIKQWLTTKNNMIGPFFNIISLSSILPILPTVGIVNPYALKKGAKLRLDKKEYLTIPSQFISFLVGLIDGDGYIQVTRTPKGYITIKLIIGLHLEDISTVEYIKSVLKLGKITINKDHKSPNCKLIFNRTDLQEIIFPLLIHHGIFFLTETRKYQFDLAMVILKNDTKLFDEIPSLNIDHRIKLLPELYATNVATALDYANLYFFKNWLVGFTVAEGSFCIKSNNDGCFQLKQSIHFQLFESFKLLFETNRQISTEHRKYNQFSVSSKTDIQKVINFFSFSGLHPLIGLKGIQYLNWLNNLQNSSRYKNLNFPR